jgi:predicted metal-dependent enzyme (double-stranded beta helix superfamily)
LVGVVENAIQETRYAMVGLDERRLPRVERRDARLLRQGDVSVLVPDDEIHELDNFSAVRTIEVHVYGANLVGLNRNCFDRATGVASAMCSASYDNC